MLKIINKGAKSDLPFSPAIQVGDLVYISGQASVDPNTCLLYTSPSPRD